MDAGVKDSTKKIALGISEDEVPLDDHLIHFWRTEEEFECGVRFLQLGSPSCPCGPSQHDRAADRFPCPRNQAIDWSGRNKRRGFLAIARWRTARRGRGTRGCVGDSERRPTSSIVSALFTKKVLHKRRKLIPTLLSGRRLRCSAIRPISIGSPCAPILRAGCPQ
jgi:hypothetical protein